MEEIEDTFECPCCQATAQSKFPCPYVRTHESFVSSDELSGLDLLDYCEVLPDIDSYEVCQR